MKKDSYMTTHDELLTANQVAEILNCHVSQVYKMIKRGQLPPMIKFGQRMARMSRSQLEHSIYTTSDETA